MYCKNCGAQLPDAAHACPECGASVDSTYRKLQERAQGPRLLGLPEAVATVLSESSLGIGLLRHPKRFLGSIMDITDNESKCLRVLIANCDEAMMQEYAKAAIEGTLEAIEDASTKVMLLLTEHRFIVKSVASQTSGDIALGIEAFLGLRTIGISGGSSQYDVFVCCKEAEDATGSRTQDGQLAATFSQSLLEAGCTVFYPRLSLVNRHGAAHGALVRDALEHARLFMVVGMSAEHLSSDWIRRCASTFLSSHDGKDALIVGYDRMEESELPKWLSSYAALRLGSSGALEDASNIVAKKAHGLPVGVPNDSSLRSGSHSKPGSVRTVSSPKTIYHEVRTLYQSGHRVQVLLIRVVRGFWAVTVKYTREGRSQAIQTSIGQLMQGQEALVIMGEYATLESLETSPIAAKSTPEDRLVWRPRTYSPGWLKLDLRNTGSVMLRVGSMDLLLDDAENTLIRVNVNAVLDSYERRLVSARLSEHDARALSKSKSGRLYLTAPDYRMIRMFD